jgi:hypothetical protein
MEASDQRATGGAARRNGPAVTQNLPNRAVFTQFFASLDRVNRHDPSIRRGPIPDGAADAAIRRIGWLGV